ncbi:phospholipase D family protein, partial [Parvibaculum sp.]|uniref:phospholipase D family protein n=1 Tax=Parvibaculum sp. TaxID=2024848 RepID=UPI0034A0A408
VRVRALVDGFHIGTGAAPLKRIARHPNVEVRIYNPFRTSFRSGLLRYTELLFDFARLNQRMHNKIVAVDNTLAIVGGRNVNDAYFGLDATNYFLDRDVVIAGPLTAEISASFDAFWNDPYAVPARDFARDDASSVNAGTVWAEAPELARDEFPLPRRIEGAELAEKFNDLRGRLVWAPGTLALTSPGPVFAGPARLPVPRIEDMLLTQLGAAQQEVVVQMSYVMLTGPRAAALEAARARGVHMVLQTNSLASTDSAIVHYGYARDRRRFLYRDVELYELKNVPQNARGMAQLGIVPEKTTLHPKTMVFDRRHVFLGSFNLDHRSILYNSEIGILIDSPVLAARVLGAIAWDIAPVNSWRVTMEPPRLIWHDESVEPPLRLDSEPNTGVMAQILTWIGYFLPIDHLL